LVSLSRHAFKAAAEGYRARRKLAAVVTAGLVNAPEKSAELSPSAWNRLTESLLDCLGPADRAKWLARIEDLYVKAETTPDLDADDVRNLSVAMDQLGSDEALDVVYDWAQQEDGQSLRAAPPGRSAYLALLAADDPARAAAMLAELEPVWEAAAASGTLSWADHGKVTRVWRRFGDKEKAQLWAQRTLLTTFGNEAQRRENAGMLALNEVGYLLSITGQIDRNSSYETYADAFLKAAEKGELDLAWRNPDHMAAPLTSAKAAQRARTALVDASGQARPMVAKILAVAYRDLGRLDELETYVESQLDQPDVAADTKATWLLARGCVEGAQSDEYAPLAGRTWFQQAFVTANDPNLRLMAIGEIALAYAELEHYQTAYQLIDSVSHQFATVEMQEKVDQLKGQIDSLRNWYTQAHITFAAAEKGN
jgi:hypothetical protein